MPTQPSDPVNRATAARPAPPRRRAGLLVAALAAVLALGACAGSDGSSNPAGVRIETESDDDGFHGSAIDPGYEVPAVALEDTDGRAVSLDDVMKPVTVVFFGYTHCPDVCGTQMAATASALRRLDADVRDQVGVVFITTDPNRDDGPALREYLSAFDESFDEPFVGLTGPMAEIEDAAEALGVALTGTEELPGGGYEVGHGSQLIGFGPDGTGQVVWTVGTPVGDLREDLATLAAQS